MSTEGEAKETSSGQALPIKSLLQGTIARGLSIDGARPARDGYVACRATDGAAAGTCRRRSADPTGEPSIRLSEVVGSGFTKRDRTTADQAAETFMPALLAVPSHIPLPPPV